MPKVRPDHSAPRPYLIEPTVKSQDVVRCSLSLTWFVLFTFISEAVNRFLMNVFPMASCPGNFGEIPLRTEFSKNPVKDRED